MTADLLARIEKILGRELEQKEKERLLRVKDILHVSDDDAIWDLLVAMEYQRTYYEELPEKIRTAATQIFTDLAQAADKEAIRAQSRLIEGVMEQARKLSLAAHCKTWLTWGLATLAILIVYGSLTMWAGYCIGSGRTLLPIFMLKMPFGVVAGIASLLAGLILGALAGKAYSEGTLSWRRHVLPSMGCFLFGTLICAMTFSL